MQWLLYALIILLVLIALLQVVWLWRARHREKRVAPPFHDVLPEGVIPQQRTLLYFYSEHCGACRSVTPLIDRLSQEQAGIVKVDVRRHIDTARRFGIKVTPSLVLVDNGIIARRHVGAFNHGTLQQFL